MKYFYRSLRYLRPYRFKIGVSLVCVILIACLWGGGLGLMLPGAKILIEAEGLHGWAYNSMAQDRLQAVLRLNPLSIAGNPPTLELQVISPHKKATAKLSTNDWLVGLDDSQPDHAQMGAVELAKVIAQADKNAQLKLRVFNQRTGRIRSEEVSLQKTSISSALLGRIAAKIPEPKKFSDRFQLFMGLLVIVLVVTALRAALTFTQEYLVGLTIWQGILDLRSDNYNVVLHLPTSFFSEKGVSDTTSRFVQDTNELARGQNTLLSKTMVEPAKAIGSLILALALSWQLTLIALIGGPPAFWLIRSLGKKMHKASRKSLESWSSMLAVLGETLIGIRVVKAYTMEGAERKRFFRVNRSLLKQQQRMERLDASTGPIVETLGITAGMAAAAGAGYMVFTGYLDRDIFLTWLVTLFAMFDPVRKLAKVLMRFQQADAAAKRVFELQDTPLEPRVSGAPMLPRHSKSIEFRNVSFRYPSAAADAVRNVNLFIKAGATVAIVGPNGSGKTTLLSLVPRLLDPTEGQIFIDGMEISQVSLRSLRRQIGLVTQDPVMFHATIGENISYGLRLPKHEDVLAAARKAFVDEFVSVLPEGYDTMVGEHGATLSGGQKQRIAIARAILRDPAILIFDEAMSQIDSDSENRIHQAMKEFVRGRTTLLIAHRFATVLSADMIAVMNEGQIIATGTHEQLLESCQIYSHLYRTQFVDSGGLVNERA